VKAAIKGEVQLTSQLEDVCYSMVNNTVPTVWAKYAYPSLKPLASWILDLL
jgi:dynein heavy chain